MRSAWDDIGKAYFEQKKYGVAEKYVKRHLNEYPRDAQGWIKYGKILTNTEQFSCAEKAFLTAISLNDRPDYYLDLQLLYTLTANEEKHSAVVKKLQATIPDDKRFIFNYAWDKIKAGDTYGGWADLEAGRDLGYFGNCYDDTTEQRLTDVSQVQGSTVAIIGEGGLGDEIIGARYADVIRKHGGTPILICCEALHSILGHLGECRTMKDRGEFDYYTPTLGSVPVFKEIPNEVYLCPKDEYVAKHRIYSDKLKVGICWHGNTEYEWEQYRSVSKDALFNLASDEVDVYSLQQDDTDQNLDSWDDTLGVIANLDMVVSSCTSVVHAAGAMGKRVLVLVPLAPYYLWTTKEDWYPEVTTMPRTTGNKEITEWICQ
jgi:tetratricopeptide (TPR) repeat protein|tara:strand:- start:99 stop:1220 length:1122 start_codon:yes stop_codon:yes gene_type:complete